MSKVGGEKTGNLEGQGAWQFGLIPEGQNSVLSDSSSVVPEILPPLDSGLRFYEPPKADLSVASSLPLQDFQNNPLVQSRLKIALEVEKLKKSEVLLSKLEEASKKKNISPEVIQAHHELIFKQTDLVGLQKRLFFQMSNLLHPEGYPVDLVDYTHAVNGLFEIFFGKLGGKKVYFTPSQIEKLFSKGLMEKESVWVELNALASQVRAGMAPAMIKTGALPAQIQTWLAQTENFGFKNSVAFEVGQFQEILKSLKEDKKPIFHCENLIRMGSEIQVLIREGKLTEAKEKYSGEYSRARCFVLELHKEYERARKLKHYTVGVAIVVAAGFLAAITEGATAPLLVQAGARLSLAKVGGALVNGLTFVTADRLLNKIFLDKDFWDPKKSSLENAGDFALKSLFIAALNPYLKEVVYASRMRSLLPEIARKGLPQELLKEGVLDLSRKEARIFLTQLFENEIATMGKLERVLFKGKEFREEVYAFLGWTMLESQVTHLAQGKKPSIENLKMIEALLKPESILDQAAFLAALKVGNRVAKPLTEPLAQQLNQWSLQKLQSAEPRPESEPTAESSTGERGPLVTPPRQVTKAETQPASTFRPLPAEVFQPSEIAYSRGPAVDNRSRPITSESVDELGSSLHEAWRGSRQRPDGSFEPRLKKTQDQIWIDAHGGQAEVDIANTAYRDLPADWQAENKASAEAAVDEVTRAILQRIPLDAAFLETASAAIHVKWLERNGAWTPEAQKRPYEELSEVEKEKDRVVIREALDIYHRLRFPNGYQILPVAKSLGFEEPGYLWTLVRTFQPGLKLNEVEEIFHAIDPVLKERGVSSLIRGAIFRQVVEGRLGREEAKKMADAFQAGSFLLESTPDGMGYVKRPTERPSGDLAPSASAIGQTSSGETFRLVLHRVGTDTYSPELTYVVPKSARMTNTVEGRDVTVEFQTWSASEPESRLITLTLSHAEVDRLGIPLMIDGKLDQSSGRRIPTFSLHRVKEDNGRAPSSGGGLLLTLTTLGAGLATLLSSETSHAMVTSAMTANETGGLLAAGALVTLGVASTGRGGVFQRIGRWFANLFAGSPSNVNLPEREPQPAEAPPHESVDARTNDLRGPEGNHPYRQMIETGGRDRQVLLETKISEINRSEEKNPLEKAQAIAKLVEAPQFSSPDSFQTIILALCGCGAGGGSKAFLLAEIGEKLSLDASQFEFLLQRIVTLTTDVRQQVFAEGRIYSNPHFINFSQLRNRFRRLMPNEAFTYWGLSQAVKNPNLPWELYELALDKIRAFEGSRFEPILNSILEHPHPHRERYLEKIANSSGTPGSTRSGVGAGALFSLTLFSTGLTTLLSSEPAHAAVSKGMESLASGDVIGFLAAGALFALGMTFGGRKLPPSEAFRHFMSEEEFNELEQRAEPSLSNRSQPKDPLKESALPPPSDAFRHFSDEDELQPFTRRPAFVLPAQPHGQNSSKKKLPPPSEAMRHFGDDEESLK
jgi:hypothetical protein